MKLNNKDPDKSLGRDQGIADLQIEVTTEMTRRHQHEIEVWCSDSSLHKYIINYISGPRGNQLILCILVSTAYRPVKTADAVVEYNSVRCNGMFLIGHYSGHL